MQLLRPFLTILVLRSVTIAAAHIFSNVLNKAPVPHESNDDFTSYHQTDMLAKRNFDLTLIHFEQNCMLTPIVNAAAALTQFYTQVALGSAPNGPWSHNNPRIFLRFTLGAFQLLMTATEPLTIPWSFVVWHASQMLESAMRGYVSTYQAYYAPPDGVGRIVVSLTYWAAQVLRNGEFGAVGDVVGGYANGPVNGVVSGAGSALNANANPFIPERALHKADGAHVGSRDGHMGGRGRGVAAP